MEPEFTGDRADLPMFGEEEMPDPSYGFLRDHSLPQSEKKDRSNAPDGRKSGRWGEKAELRLAERDCIRHFPRDCQNGAGHWKIDPSRGGGIGTAADDPGGRADLLGLIGGAGLLHGIGDGVLLHDRAHYSSAARGNKRGR